MALLVQQIIAFDEVCFLHVFKHEDHEKDDKENGHGDEHKREAEIAAVALGVVQPVDDEPSETDVTPPPLVSPSYVVSL